MKVIDFLSKKKLKEKTKNEILKDFKNELEKRFSYDTAKTYYSSLNCALKTQNISSDSLRWDLILEYALTLKNRNQVSKLKNALKHFDYDNYLSYKDDLNNIHKSKWKAKRKFHDTFMLDSTLKRINNIRNNRLKIGYRLMLLTGMRVQEVSKLKKKDIEFEKINNRKNSRENYKILIHGKGNKIRKIYGIMDFYVQKKLKELISNCKNDNSKIFYSANYMQKTAAKYNFHCHQLRRAFAHIAYYYFDCSKDQLRGFLGHADNTKTYLKYINYPVSLYGTRWDIGE